MVTQFNTGVEMYALLPKKVILKCVILSDMQRRITLDAPQNANTYGVNVSRYLVISKVVVELNLWTYR